MLVVLTLALSVLCIVAHEFGHLLAARFMGVPVEEFSVGLGPIVWRSARPGGTKYTLRAFPISGAIALEPESEGIRWLPIFLAGPAINLLLAAVLMQTSALYSVSGTKIGAWERLLQWERLDRTDAFSIAASVSRSYGLVNLLPAVGFDGGQCLVLLGRAIRRRRAHT